ncbi:MAG: DUF5104 domain-containing protein [Butyrivibrio sp.]
MTKKAITKFILVICTLSVFLSACNHADTTASIETITTADEETTSLSDYYYLNDVYAECTEKEIESARKSVETIVEALNSGDAGKIKSVLTGVALQDTKHLDEEIQYVFDMLDGEIVKTEEYRWKTIEELIYEENRSAIYMDYNVYTGNQSYNLTVLYLPREDTKLDNTGVFSFVLGDYDREDSYYWNSIPMLNKIPGAFSSDKETIEYNSKILSDLFNEYWGDETENTYTALQMGCVGVEKIKDFQAETGEYNDLDLIITDALENQYYVSIFEGGGVELICENDKTGKELFFWRKQ